MANVLEIGSTDRSAQQYVSVTHFFLIRDLKDKDVRWPSMLRFIEAYEWSNLFWWSNICSHARMHAHTLSRRYSLPFLGNEHQLNMEHPHEKWIFHSYFCFSEAKSDSHKAERRLLTVSCYCY